MSLDILYAEMNMDIGKTGDHNTIGIKKEQKKMELGRDQEEFQEEGEKKKNGGCSI